jgi:hypothetical protein
MQATDWAPEHSDALREFLAKGMSYSKAADAINAKFGTRYTRNAAIGRGKRMGSPAQKSPRTHVGCRAKRGGRDRADRVSVAPQRPCSPSRCP